MRRFGWILSVALLTLAACARPAPAAPGPPTAASIPPLKIATPSSAEEGQVTHVVDGDTIDVTVNGRVLRVRYIGMNTPESVDPNRPVQCFGKEASERNKELVGGKRVRLERDVSDTDRFGRHLRYVWLGDEMINARLLQEGYAQTVTFPPDVRHVDLFRGLQQDARDGKHGLWSACPTR